jgi:hypothetical protein
MHSYLTLEANTYWQSRNGDAQAMPAFYQRGRNARS